MRFVGLLDLAWHGCTHINYQAVVHEGKEGRRRMTINFHRRDEEESMCVYAKHSGHGPPGESVYDVCRVHVFFL